MDATNLQIDNKRARGAVEGDKEDRISGLPRHITDHILELVPVKDAARTCVLSKSWRYIWTTLPTLKLGYNLNPDVLYGILLLHVGDIVKFVLNFLGARRSYKALDIDKWVLYVTRNGVKHLNLSFPLKDMYKLPPCIFNCPALAHLDLTGCVFKPPTSLVFPNLVTFSLEDITFELTELCVIKTPLLTNLTLISCKGTQYLNIVSPRLKELYVLEKPCCLLLNSFMNYTNLTELILYTTARKTCLDVRSTLEKLLVSLPALEVLRLGKFFVQNLNAGISASAVPFMLNCMRSLWLEVDFAKLSQISGALRLIKSSPNLSKLVIWAKDTKDKAEVVLKYLDAPDCLEQPLNKLEYVYIDYFNRSKAEVRFVKLLLSRTPSLLRMCIDEWPKVGAEAEGDILRELVRFPRASPKAELVYPSV